jgi:hypothetical protein
VTPVRARLFALAWLATSLAACLGDFESTPAYEEQRFLCGAAQAAEWQALVDDCRARFLADPAACGGVMSVEGSLLGDPVRATSEVDSSVFLVMRLPEGRALARVDATGVTPYFAMTLTWNDLGGPAEDAPSPPREVGVVSGGSAIAPVGDPTTEFAVRASDGVSARLFSGRTGSVRITAQTARELAGSFDAGFAGASDELSGCFHVFAQRVRIEAP